MQAVKDVAIMVLQRQNIGLYGRIIAAIMVITFVGLLTPQHASAYELSDFSKKDEMANIMPGATSQSSVQVSPPSAVAYKGDAALGYVFLNSTTVSAIGYSGKPIHVVVGVSTAGVITGARMVKHHEPIVLVGIPENRIHEFIDRYIGLDVLQFVAHKKSHGNLEIVSGATVTVMVIDDTIIRSAIKILRQRNAAEAVADVAPRENVSIRLGKAVAEDWQTLLGDGSVRRLRLSLDDVNHAFAMGGGKAAIARPELGAPDLTFIDLYAAVASIPTIGLSLLGPGEYANLGKAAAPGQQAIIIAGRGRYSFKGSGYVRGGIFDRIQLIQGDISVRFRDKYHKRIGEIKAAGAGRFPEIGLFLIPVESEFDPAKPWRLQLLVHRAIGPIKKAFTTFDLGYQPPERYLLRQAVETAAAPTPISLKPTVETPLWVKIWRNRIVDIVILVASLCVLTSVFFFQDWLVRRPRLTVWLRNVFLFYTVVWLGFYANAQLSVVNTMTFFDALLNDFRWEFFLVDPLIFILWGSVAVSLLFWGRGVYCGWLCPFGALQELLNKAARVLKIPQLAVPWALHERLWPLKYVIFLGILGLSLYSFEMAEMAAEVEPFKTSIILKFARAWPFVLFALAVLGLGLFVERAYCRYFCPLGGALGIPGRMRMNDWLRRYPECGTPCQRCKAECMVQAIHPNGQINPNECLQCLHCQALYYDDHKCPVMIKKRLRREHRQAEILKPPPSLRHEAEAAD